MSRTSVIWKYQLAITDEPQSFDIPEPGMLCMVANQNGALCLWLQVDPSRPTEKQTFRVHGTGHEIADREDYVGSAVIGSFVWHVFRVLPDLVDEFTKSFREGTKP
jgi:hypothetical protein